MAKVSEAVEVTDESEEEVEVVKVMEEREKVSNPYYSLFSYFPPQSGSASPRAEGAIPTRKKQDRKKLITAYILFSADVRKLIMEENPGTNFREISRKVAERWRQMAEADKQMYAERAKKLNEEKEREELRKEAERIQLEEEEVVEIEEDEEVSNFYTLWIKSGENRGQPSPYQSLSLSYF